jgi:hypothetical protein
MQITCTLECVESTTLPCGRDGGGGGGGGWVDNALGALSCKICAVVCKMSAAACSASSALCIAASESRRRDTHSVDVSSFRAPSASAPMQSSRSLLVGTPARRDLDAVKDVDPSRRIFSTKRFSPVESKPSTTLRCEQMSAAAESRMLRNSWESAMSGGILEGGK